MSWLSKLFGRGRAADSEAGVGEDGFSFLKKDLGKLDRAASGLAARALRFVLDGEGADVLLTLGGIKEGGKALDLNCIRQSYRRNPNLSRARFLGTLDIASAATALRLAQVYEAASRQERASPAPSTVVVPAWLPIFVEEALGAERFSYPFTHKGRRLDIRLPEEMLRLDGESTAHVVRPVLLADPTDYTARYTKELFEHLDGFAECASRHPEAVREALSSSARVRAEAISILRQMRFDFRPFALELVALAVAAAKTSRAAVEPLMSELKTEVLPLVKEKASAGLTDERDHALRLLARLEGAGARAFLEERRSQETSKKALQTLRQLLQSAPSPDEDVKAAAALTLSPLPPLTVDTPLGADTLKAFQMACAKRNDTVQAHYEKYRAQWRWLQKPNVLSSADVSAAFALLTTLTFRDDQRAQVPFPFSLGGVNVEHLIVPLLERPELSLVHFVRLMRLLGEIAPAPNASLFSFGVPDSYFFGFQFDRFCRAYRKSHPPAFGLRELAQVFGALGLDPDLIGRQYLGSGRWRQNFHWEDDAVSPYFTERTELLEEVLEVRPSRMTIESWLRADVQRNAYAVMAVLPGVPSGILPHVWEKALGTSKGERALAQEALARVPGHQKTILAALESGKQEARANAAEWLGRLRAKEAAASIEKALTKEKKDVPKGAMMNALELLGVPIERFLHRDELLKDAEKGLAAGIPESLRWFPFDLMPEAHWQDTKAKLEPPILKWFLVQSFKLKTPEPGPVLRRYASSIRKEEAERFGRFVLDAWIAEDTRLPDAAALAEKCRAQAKQQLRWFRGFTEEQLYRQLLASAQDAPEGSAIQEKGILAVAAAMSGSGHAAPVERYLKRWYGLRSAQSKALLQMLSWVDSPNAIQLLLSVASRFRTAGIRKEAERLVEVLAERRGWTVGELADRTIPWAGFERGEDGRAALWLDYGPRAFRATLDGELRIVVTSEQGKAVKSLPAPGKDDDPVKAKDAKKKLSAARREIQSVITHQTERLNEAMCTERSWPCQDWRAFLLEHPVVGRFCQRLVWIASAPDSPDVTFRPLEDGSLTDASDSEVRISEGARVRLAHDSNLDPEMGRAWLDHLRDYDVTPLLQQFGRGVHELSETEKEKTEIAEFEGHLLQAFALRSLATKLGYIRGDAGDGGFFYSYHKHFPSLELETVVEFSGNTLPEENRTVALKSLYFVPKPKAGAPPAFGGQERLPLSSVPKVLLSESWNDMRSLSEQGSGYDPNWEKKIAW